MLKNKTGSPKETLFSQAVSHARQPVRSLVLAGLAAVLEAFSLTGCVDTGLKPDETDAGPGVQPVAEGPAAVAKLAVSGPLTLVSGKCSSFYTIGTLDSSGNSTLAEAELSISLKADGPGAFYGDAGCTARPIRTAKVAAGENYAVFRFRASKPGNDTIEVSAASLTSATIVTAVSASDTALIGLSGPSATDAGTCAGPFEIALSDADSNATQTTRGITIGIYGGGHGAFYPSAGCAEASITNLAIAKSASGGSFYFRDEVSESASFTLTAPSHNRATVTLAIAGEDPARLILAKPTSTPLPNGCSKAFTLSATDVYGNIPTFASALSVTLGGQGTGSFYSDGACATAVSSATLNNASASATLLYFKAPTPQTLTLASSATGLTGSSVVFDIVPGTAELLTLAGPSGAQPGECVGPYTLTTRDSQSFASNVGGQTVIAIGNAGHGSFYADSACSGGQTLAAFTVVAGSSQPGNVIYFKDPNIETPNIGLSATGFTSIQFPITVIWPPVTQLALAGPSTSTAAVCSSTAFTVLTKAATGQVVPVMANLTVSLSGESSGAFYSDSACATAPIHSVLIADTFDRAPLYYKGGAVENITMTAQAAGKSNGTLAHAVSAGNPTQLTFGGAVSITAGACAAYTSTLRDANQFASPASSNTTLTLSGNTIGSFYPDSGCAGGPSGTSTVSQGTSQAIYYFKSTTAGTVNLDHATGTLTHATTAVTINPDAANRFQLTGASSLTVLSGCNAYTVAIQDVYGNTRASGASRVTNLSGNGAGGLFSAANCTGAIAAVSFAAGDSAQTFYYSNGTIESVTLTASDGSLTNGTMPVSVQAGPATQLALTGTSSFTAGTCAAFSSSLKDANSYPAQAAGSVTISYSGNAIGTFYADSGCSASTTSATVAGGGGGAPLYYKSNTSGAISIAQSGGGLSATGMSVTILADSPTQFVLTGSSGPVAGACTTYNLYVQDVFGNTRSAATGRSVSLTGNGSGTFYSTGGCAGPITTVSFASSDSGKTIYYGNTVAETNSLVLGDGALTNATLSVTVAPGAPASFTLTAPGATARTSDCAGSYTITQLDAYGNVAPGSPAVTYSVSGTGSGTVFSGANCLTSTAAITIGSASGRAIFSFGDRKIESLTLTVDDGPGGFSAVSSTLNVISGFPLATAGAHNCAILSDNQVKCWGLNASRLGIGDNGNRGDNAGEMGSSLPYVNLGLNNTVAARLVAGFNHNCVITDSGAVKCWGANGNGQLGIGSTTAKGNAVAHMGANLASLNMGTGRIARNLFMGQYHTCAILDDATTKCWGMNTNGQLGIGDAGHRGDAANELGNNLPAISLGSGRYAIAVAGAANSSCAILDDGSVKCWGLNNVGQLGLGDTLQRGSSSGQMGDSLPSVDLGANRTATKIDAGLNFTCVLLDNSQLKCWGANNFGQLGQGDAGARGDSAGEMGSGLPAINVGANRSVTAFDLGDNHVVALLDNGTVKAWGSNANGQLGIGATTTAHRGDAANEMGDTLPIVQLGTNRTASFVTAQSMQTCALLDNGSIKCWGRNSSGESGYGDTIQRGDAIGEMGENLPAVSVP